MGSRKLISIHTLEQLVKQGSAEKTTFQGREAYLIKTNEQFVLYSAFRGFDVARLIRNYAEHYLENKNDKIDILVNKKH